MKRLWRVLRIYIVERWSTGSRTLRVHIEQYLYIFGLVAVLGIAVVLFLTNNIFPGRNNVSSVISREVELISASVDEHMSGMTAEAINFSETLSADIEYRLGEAGITFAELESHPELLFDLLDRATDRVILALARANCSGVYLVLNASINPSLPNAEYSRAGIYLRRIEPKRIGNASEMLYLRGFTAFAQRRNMTLQANWDLEFDIEDQAFWELPMQLADEGASRKLSDLYSWQFGKIIPQNKENSLICSIPLIGENGVFLGVCGFEITDASFRYQHTLDTKEYPELTVVFSTLGDDGSISIGADSAMFSGDKMLERDLLGGGALKNVGAKNKLAQLQTGQVTYFGVYNEMPLYHARALYSGQHFALAVLISEENFDRIIRSDVTRVMMIFAIMLVLGLVVSVLLSSKIAKPLDTALIAMANTQSDDSGNPTLSVGIKELDALLQLFAENNPGQTAQVEVIFVEFLDKLRLLTPTERVIVARYMDGQDFERVMNELFIANSTLKTHNIHIYKKLEVRGANEIKLYLSLINRSNLAEQLSELLDIPLQPQQLEDASTLG